VKNELFNADGQTDGLWRS